MSQEHSYAIRSSYHDSVAAAHDLGAAKALRFPSVTLNAVSYYINELQTIDLPVSSIEIGSHENYQADLRLNLPLYTGGKISRRIGIQRELAAARGFSLKAARIENAYLTRKGYLNLMLSRTIVRSAEASLTRLKIINRDVANLYTNGLADSSDLLEAELAIQKATEKLEEKRNASENAAISFNRLLGIDPDEEIVLLEEPSEPDFAHYREGESKTDSVRRAELKIFESGSRAAKIAVDLKRASLFPDLGTYAQYSYGKPNNDMFNKTWNDYWVVGLNLKWEFNLGGRSVKNIYSAKEQAKSAEMRKMETQEALALQADIALHNLEFAHRVHIISKKEYEMAKGQYQLAKEKKKVGNLSLNRLLEMESDLTGAEQMYRASVINYYIADTEYLYATGSSRIYGGF